MEETGQPVVNPTPVENVGFPGSVQPQRKKGGKKWILIVIVFLAIIGGVTFFVLKGSSSSNTEGDLSATPSDSNTLTQPSQTSTPSPSPSSAPVDKTQIRIQVLNGTGIPGEAAYLQDSLRVLGYTNITTGNSDVQTATTTNVTFSNSVASSVFDEVLAKLKGIYQTVSSTTSRSMTSFDIQIIVGLKKGATPKPQDTSSPTASPAATPQ